jgi:hypothetical protein
MERKRGNYSAWKENMKCGFFYRIFDFTLAGNKPVDFLPLRTRTCELAA